MTITPIPNLPPVTNLTGAEIVPIVQSGVTSRGTILQIGQVIVGGAVGISGVYAEQLTVTSTNVVSNLTLTPKGGFYMIALNQQVFFAVGAAGAFNVTGQTVNWTSGTFTINTGDTVYAIYTY